MLQNHLRGSVTQSVIFADVSQNWSTAYTLHSNPIPQQMVQMAFCDLLHTCHKQVTNVSQHVFVILLWGILTSPLTPPLSTPQELMPDHDAVLYVDTDILFLRPPEDVWQFFYRFNSSQIAAVAPETEDAHTGWYNRFARHPYYPPLGECRYRSGKHDSGMPFFLLL